MARRSVLSSDERVLCVRLEGFSMYGRRDLNEEQDKGNVEVLDDIIVNRSLGKILNVSVRRI